MNFVNCWETHRQLYIILLIFTALTGFFWSPNLLYQFYILVAGVLIIGIAHGAIDYRFGRDLFEPSTGYFWLLLFTGAYLSLGFAMLGFWILSPQVGLLIFLLLAIPHFGFEDVQLNRYSPLTGYLLGLAIGALPIALPCFFAPEQTSEVFNFLLPDSQHLKVVEVYTISGYLFFASIISMIIGLFIDNLYDETDAGEVFYQILEVCALIVMFSLTEPILAFTVYYCAGHSSREMLEIMDEAYSGTFSNRLGQFLLEALPIAIATVLIGIMAGFTLTKFNLEIGPILALTIFVGLSIVLIPHMLFDVLHDHYA